MGDLILGSRSLLNYLINGGSGVEGLQDRVEALFTPPAPKVQSRYTYDPATKGLLKLESPLKQAYVTILTTTRVKRSFYRKDRHPTEPAYAWARRFNMQWDIWGRTPVEVDAISDALELIVVQMNHQMWDANRIALTMSEFEDAPLEIETGIYRAIARGYCQVAQVVVDG